MNASARFLDAIATRKFCREGLVWAHAQPNLRTAWAACANGRWMAWWLRAYCDHTYETLKPIADACGVDGVYSDRNPLSVPPPPAALYEYAEALRKRFTFTGKRR